MKMILSLKNKEIPLYICTSFKDNLLGLMGKKNINYALRFKCKSIHTFFMREKIDIVVTDKNNKVIAVYNNFKKNRILINLKSYYIYELPNNFNTYKVKDTIKITSFD